MAGMFEMCSVVNLGGNPKCKCHIFIALISFPLSVYN